MNKTARVKKIGMVVMMAILMAAGIHAAEDTNIIEGIDWGVGIKASNKGSLPCLTGETNSSFYERPDDGEFIKWQSAIVPEQNKGKKVTFMMAAGMGSNLGEGSHELFMNGKKILEIITSYETTVNWKSDVAAGKFETKYADENNDIFGIFSVTVDPKAIEYGKSQNFEMKGKTGLIGKGWFSISEVKDLNSERLKKPMLKLQLMLARKDGAHALLLTNLKTLAGEARDVFEKFFSEKGLELDIVPPFETVVLQREPSVLVVESLEAPIFSHMNELARMKLMQRVEEAKDPGAYLILARQMIAPPRSEKRPIVLLVLGKTDKAAVAGAKEALKILLWKEGSLYVSPTNNIAVARLEDVKPDAAAMDKLLLAGPGKDGLQWVQLCVSEKNKTTDRILALWEDIFKDHDINTAVIEGVNLPKNEGGEKRGLVAFETESACPVAKAAGIELGRLKDANPEAYIFAVREWAGRPLICIIGKTVTRQIVLW